MGKAWRSSVSLSSVPSAVVSILSLDLPDELRPFWLGGGGGGWMIF